MLMNQAAKKRKSDWAKFNEYYMFFLLAFVIQVSQWIPQNISLIFIHEEVRIVEVIAQIINYCIHVLMGLKLRGCYTGFKLAAI